MSAKLNSNHSQLSCHVNSQDYQALKSYALHHPQAFWGQQATRFLHFFQPWHRVTSGDLASGNVRWFEGALLNVCYNCLDRHLASQKDRTAIIWQGTNPHTSLQLTYIELYDQVCRLANVLKKRNINKGDCVAIYMPMIPEAIVAMLACTRIGAIHVVIFAGFSSRLLENCILKANCKAIITVDQGIVSGNVVAMKKNVDMARSRCLLLHTVIIVRRTGKKIDWFDEQDIWYHQAIRQVSNDCPCEIMAAHDPLFILYSINSSQHIKGVVYSSAGYLLYVAMTYYYILDHQDGEIYWCSVDMGSITGHSYLVYGPLANGATIFTFENTLNMTTFSRFEETINRYKINIFYTTLNVIHHLIRVADNKGQGSLQSLRLLASIGISKDQTAWNDCLNMIAKRHCMIVDTWLQPETGGILMASTPRSNYCEDLQLQAFLGIKPVLLDKKGQLTQADLGKAHLGQLAIEREWPAMRLALYDKKQQKANFYNPSCHGYFATGFMCYDNKHHGYRMISGITDSVKIVGCKIDSIAIENMLKKRQDIADVAVICISSLDKGQSIYVFICLYDDELATDKHKDVLLRAIEQQTDCYLPSLTIYFIPDMPRTDAGDMLRLVLRYIITGEIDKIGDTSILANPSIIDILLKIKNKLH